MTETKEKKKVVALLSGGLDSQLAVRMMQEQGFDVSAVAIKPLFVILIVGEDVVLKLEKEQMILMLT